MQRPHVCGLGGCRFSSNSAVGLSVHRGRVHGGNVVRYLSSSRNKKDLPKLPTPTCIGGDGLRIAADRVTEALGKGQECESNNTHGSANCDDRDEVLTIRDGLERDEEKGGIDMGIDDAEKSDISSFVRMLVQLEGTSGRAVVDKLFEEIRERGVEISEVLKKVDKKYKYNDIAKNIGGDLFSREGFHAITIRTKSGRLSTLYKRNGVDLLRRQMKKARRVFTDVQSNSEYSSHPINGGLGKNVLPAVRRAIRTDSDADVVWREGQESSEQSFVGLGQVYSDKSKTALNAWGLSFYPMHLVLLNYPEQCRRDLICSGMTCVAYLPVYFEDEMCGTGEGSIVGNGEEVRLESIDTLHRSAETALEEVTRSARQGFRCEDANGRNLRCHVCIASYVADIPEMKELLSVKHGISTSLPCPRCVVKREDLSSGGTHDARTWSHAKELYRSRASATKDALREASMHAVPPAFSSHPFQGICPELCIYDVFCFEPMHNFHLGLTRLLCEATMSRLKSELRSNAMVRTDGEGKMFRGIRMQVMGQMNMFLHDVHKTSIGRGLRLDFGWKSITHRHNGLFSDNGKGVMGMLQARDFKCLLQVLPYLGAIVDTMCGEISEGSVTEVFTSYVDLVQETYRTNATPAYDSKVLRRVERLIKRFKDAARDTLGKYHSIYTLKWHLVDHLVHDVSKYGGMTYMEADLYESCHRRFKDVYRRTNKRQHTAMERAMDKINERDTVDMFVKGVDMKGRVRKKTLRVRCAQLGSTVIGEKGDSCLFEDFMEVQEKLTERWYDCSGVDLETTGEENLPGGKGGAVREVMSRCGNDGFVSFVNSMKEILREEGRNSSEMKRTRLTIVSSGYVPGMRTPCLKDSNKSGALVTLTDSGRRVLQKIVASKSYYGSEHPRLDSVMIAGHVEKRKRSGREKGSNVWFAQLQVLVRIRVPCIGGRCDGNIRSESGVYEGRTGRLCEKCNNLREQELMFVQYYDIIDGQSLPPSTVDTILNCVRLKWARSGDREGHVGKVFGLHDVTCLLGAVHVVPMYKHLEELSEHVERRRQWCELSNNGGTEEGSARWVSEMYYVNRFYSWKEPTYDL